MADSQLKGKKVAIVAADMVERVELIEPRKALEAAGATTELISLKPGEIKTFNHFDPAETEKVDKTAEEVDAGDYDALMIPGGVGNPDQLRGDENVVKFVQDFFEQWQAGKVNDLHGGLKKLASQLDAQVAQAGGGGGVP